MKTRWIVIWKKDTDPAEIYPFDDEKDALAFYERAQVQWTGVWLCKVIKSCDIPTAGREKRT